MRFTDINTLQNCVDEVIERTLIEKRIVGTVVQIALRGELVYSRAKGLADREQKRPMQENALFRYASVTKPIVSTAALILFSQDKLRLDDPVVKWLPSFRPKLPNGQYASITIRHLITHTAGLTYRFFQEDKGAYEMAEVSDGMDISGITLEENLERLATAPLLYEPGKMWRYSIATDVLGAVIEKITGMPLSEAVQMLVTHPLHMNDTSFIAVDKNRLTAAYADSSDEPRRLHDNFDTIPFIEGTAGFRLAPDRANDKSAYPSGGAGMVGSAGDFLKLLETLRQGGDPILPKAIVTEMTTNQIGDLEMPYWPGRGFGLGFTLLKDPKAANTSESPGTWRMGGTYGHSWFVDPSQELSVVAFTNTALEGMSGRFTTDLCEAVYAGLQGSNNNLY
ncbi:serine hydrolase domain-containing protein [Paenibacillus brasilensis]|uniref:CubicO group peptidase (Beta-lactamase class C family) n=1 Tax=Paenibacillus brasilensis TaxID=128574 RepID=A0ABU0L348_9BACL|nr:serine hydrolase domain-containing protein [Paenibacillus brasilensis]MDQ0495626.1 CubicO group peptidase (beta-lactamase class C family) [Paenibacillus brasilensis]